jgi:hypothetical protein
MTGLRSSILLFTLVLWLPMCPGVAGRALLLPAHNAAITVVQTTYNGWPGSFLISNGKAEVVVVPAIGRVMQFHFVGEGEVFWENPTLYGKFPEPNAKEWGNFGGDKTWPTPQSQWMKMIGRPWPPPATFDSVPLQAVKHGTAVELISPVDPAFGVRFRRIIRLDPQNPKMSITTTYEKVAGEPVKVGIGVITQLTDPERVFMVLPTKSMFPNGYVKQQFDLPEDLAVSGRFVSMRRGREAQIGSDAGTLIWMNSDYVLRIDSPRVPVAQYGDQDASATIYTSSGPLKYVELEPFGPISTMKVGDRIERSVTYTLSRRTKENALEEAQASVDR